MARYGWPRSQSKAYISMMRGCWILCPTAYSWRRNCTCSRSLVGRQCAASSRPPCAAWRRRTPARSARRGRCERRSTTGKDQDSREHLAPSNHTLWGSSLAHPPSSVAEPTRFAQSAAVWSLQRPVQLHATSYTSLPAQGPIASGRPDTLRYSSRSCAVIRSWRKTSVNRRRPSWPNRSRSAGSATRRFNAGGQPVDVARRHQNARLVRNHHFAGAVHVVAHHRLAGDQRLRQHPGKPLAQTGVDHDVHRGDQLGDSLRRHQAGELEMIGQPRGGNLLLQPAAKDAVADEEKSDVRARRRPRCGPPESRRRGP